MKTLTFTPEQTASFPFPIGCPVWYFPTSEDEIDECKNLPGYSVRQGVVERASMELGAVGQICYRVVHKEKVIGDALPEKNLGYAFQCPVTVAAGEGDADGPSFEATVLQAKFMDQGIIYTVMHNPGGGRMAYKDKIPSERVKYRPDKKLIVDSAPNVAAQERQPPLSEVTIGGSVARSVSSCNQNTLESATHHSETSENNDISEAAGKTPAKSMPRDDDVALEGATRGDHNLTLTPATTFASMDSTDAGRPAKRAKLLENHPSLEIPIPAWLQKDKDSRDRLYAHLYGPSDNPHYKQMRKQANCNMLVHRNGGTNRIMTIRVTLMNQGTGAKEFNIARQMIQNILFGFKLPGKPPIYEDGSRGRLVYEIARSCRGSHRPGGSTSHAVTHQRDPFNTNSTCSMSLVELPSDIGHDRWKHLQKSRVIESVQKTGCSMKLCGDELNCPVNYGNPYIFVASGSATNWRDVDRAVELIKAEIRNYINTSR